MFKFSQPLTFFGLPLFSYAATPMTFASTSDVISIDVDMGVAVGVGVVAVDVGVVAVDMIAWP